MAKKQSNSRSARWARAIEAARAGLDELVALQEEYQEWQGNLPENLASSPLGEKLEAVCDLDIQSAIDALDEFENADLPLGFGRD